MGGSIGQPLLVLLVLSQSLVVGSGHDPQLVGAAFLGGDILVDGLNQSFNGLEHQATVAKNDDDDHHHQQHQQKGLHGQRHAQLL